MNFSSVGGTQAGKVRYVGAVGQHCLASASSAARMWVPAHMETTHRLREEGGKRGFSLSRGATCSLNWSRTAAGLKRHGIAVTLRAFCLSLRIANQR